MKDEEKTKEQLIQELAALRQRNTKLEASEAERKQAEEALRENEERFRSIIENTDVGYFFIDKDGIIQDVNKAWVKIYKYSSADEILGKHFTIIQKADDVEKAKEFVDGIMRGDTRYLTDEFSRKCKDGTIGYHTFSARPVSRSGKVIGIEGFIIDTTARRQAEEALRESEKHLRSLFETMAEGVILIAPDGQITQANPAAERILGLKRSEIEARNYVAPAWEILRSDGTPMPPEEMAGPRAMREKRPVKDVIMGVKRPDSSISWINVSAAPIIDETGNLDGVVGTFTDITERRRTEKALQESEGRYRFLLGSIVDSVYVLNPEWRHVVVNDAAERFVQIPKKTLLENKLTDLFPGIEETEFFKVFQRVMETREADTIVNEYTFENGWKGWYEVRVYPVPEGILCISRNITERKQAEDELRLFKTIIESSQEAIAISDPDGQLVYINPAHEKLFGRLLEEARQVNYRDYYPPESIEVLNQEVAPALARGDGWEGELDVFDAHGRCFPLWERADSICDADGKMLYAFGLMHDVTERKRAEEALKEHSERLEEMVEERTRALREAQEELVRKEKLAVLGVLAGGVGHELRNPLGVLSNAVYYLKMILSDADETIREYLDIISSEVHNAEKIVSDLLDFSRTHPPEREAIAIPDLVDRVLKKHPAPEGVQVITEIVSDLPAVFVDPRQIGQVLVNLITNAYQAMPEGGQLTIKTSEVSGKPPRSRGIALSITDTGGGIPPQNLEKLFEPLFTTKAKGIGLGLSVSKNLVEANGGSIEVNSEEDRGSTFTIILPPEEVVS